MILDTNALSAFADGDEGIRPILEAAACLVIPSIVLGEYYFGVLQSRYRRKYEEWLNEVAREDNLLAPGGGNRAALRGDSRGLEAKEPTSALSGHLDRSACFGIWAARAHAGCAFRSDCWDQKARLVKKRADRSRRGAFHEERPKPTDQAASRRFYFKWTRGMKSESYTVTLDSPRGGYEIPSYGFSNYH